MQTTTLIEVLKSNGLQAWEDCNGDIEIQEDKQVITIDSTVEAVKKYLTKEAHAESISNY